MKITAERKTLLEAFKFGGLVAGKSRQIPIYDYCKVSVKSGKMIVTSTDGEVTVSKKVDNIECDVDSAEFCIIPVELISILSSLKDDKISMDIEETVCSILHAKGVAKMSIASAEDFPTVKKKGERVTFQLESERLYNWLNTSKSFLGSINQALNGMYLAVEDGKAWCAASDSQKLFLDGYSSPLLDGQKIDMVVPSKMIGYSLPVIDYEDSVMVCVDETQISFIVSDAKISCQKHILKYPNVKSVIPSNNSIVAKVDTKSLMESISRVKIFADKSSNQVKLSFNSFGLTLNSQDLMQNKSCEDSCPIMEYSGEAIDIYTKISNIESVISKIDTQNTIIEMESRKRAIVIKEENNEDKLFLVMPCLGN